MIYVLATTKANPFVAPPGKRKYFIGYFIGYKYKSFVSKLLTVVEQSQLTFVHILCIPHK